MEGHEPEPRQFEWDCAIFGAGPAGLSAALTLGRCCRRVVVFDENAPRNAAAIRSHGILGHDGIAPQQLRDRGIDELAPYGVHVVERSIGPESVHVGESGIVVDGRLARTVIIATGASEQTPDIEGFDEIYGHTAHTCPYCDAWEHRGERIAVLVRGTGAAHMARLLLGWSDDVVVLTDGAEVANEERHALAEAGIPVRDAPIERFVSRRGRLSATALADGSVVESDALFFHVGLSPHTGLGVALGCDLNDGGYLIVEEHHRATSVDRVYGAGNCSSPKHNIPLVIADGVRAAVSINERLVAEDHATTPDTRASGH